MRPKSTHGDFRLPSQWPEHQCKPVSCFQHPAQLQPLSQPKTQGTDLCRDSDKVLNILLAPQQSSYRKPLRICICPPRPHPGKHLPELGRA